ncbi:MAG: S8 family serine peptidase [Candidatus Nitrosotenuis sp.]
MAGVWEKLVLLSVTVLAIVSFQQSFASTDISIPFGTSSSGCELEIEGCFRPWTISIETGEEVTWINDDSAAHTITSGNTEDGPNGIFDSDLIMPGETFSYTFDEATVYFYFCTIHPWMTGIVIVTPTADSTPDNVEDDSSNQSTRVSDVFEVDGGDAGIFDVEYTIEGGTVNDMYVDLDNTALIISVDPISDGEIELTIPRELIDARITTDKDDVFFVLVDGDEIEFEEHATSDSRILSIPFTSGIEEIEIIGTQIGSRSLPPSPSSVGPVQIAIEPIIPTEGEEMPIHVSFTDSDGNAIEHINYDIVAIQNGVKVLSELYAHVHLGDGTHYTAVLTSSDPVAIQLTILGIGLPDDEENWSVPPSAIISWQTPPPESELTVDDNNQICQGHFGEGFYYDEFEDMCLPPSGSWDDPGVDYMNQQCQDRYMSGFYYDASENVCLPPSGSWDDPGVDYMNQQCQDRFGMGIYYDYSLDACLPPSGSWHDFTNNVSSYGMLYGATFYSGKTPEPILTTITDGDGTSYDEFIIPGETLLSVSPYDWADVSQTITDSGGTVLSKIPMMGFYRIQIDDVSQLISNLQQKPYIWFVFPNTALSTHQRLSDSDIVDLRSLGDILDLKKTTDYRLKNPDPTAPVILAVIDDFIGNGKETPHGDSVVGEIQAKAPKIPIMRVQYFDTLESVISNMGYALQSAIDHKQKIVFNLSFGPKTLDDSDNPIPGWETTYSNFIKRILEKLETSKWAVDGNVSVFAAAGNGNQDVTQPLQEVMNDPRFGHLYKKMYTVVGQFDDSLNPMSYGQRGSNYDDGVREIIYDYATESVCKEGTSCTTPNAAATAATLWTARPSSSASDIKNAIRDSAIVDGVHQVLNPQRAYNYLTKCLPACDQIKYKTDIMATKDLPLTKNLVEHPPKVLVRTVSISESKLPPVIHVINGRCNEVNKYCEIKIATATGGSSPYHFQSDTFASGTPPLGMSVKTGKDLQSGYLSGTPSRDGKYTFGVCAVDQARKSSCAQVKVIVGEEQPKPVPVGGYDGQYNCDITTYLGAPGTVRGQGSLSCSSGRCEFEGEELGDVDAEGYFTSKRYSVVGNPGETLQLTGKFSTTDQFTLKGVASAGSSQTLTCTKR